MPGNLPDNSKVPVIGFISHMDTSPEVSGANVNPVIHKNYQGGDIVLPKDPTQVITVEKSPDLKNLIGDDIITADGTTLLGSDDKAGCAEIMTLIDTLKQNPQGPSPSPSRRTKRSAAALINSTSRDLAQSSPTRLTAKSSVKSAMKPGPLKRRR